MHKNMEEQGNLFKQKHEYYNKMTEETFSSERDQNRIVCDMLHDDDSASGRDSELATATDTCRIIGTQQPRKSHKASMKANLDIHFVKKKLLGCGSKNKNINLKSDDCRSFNKLKDKLGKTPKETVLPRELLQHVTDTIKQKHRNTDVSSYLEVTETWGICRPTTTSKYLFPTKCRKIQTRENSKLAMNTDEHSISQSPASFISELDGNLIAQRQTREHNIAFDCATSPVNIVIADCSERLNASIDPKTINNSQFSVNICSDKDNVIVENTEYMTEKTVETVTCVPKDDMETEIMKMGDNSVREATPTYSIDVCENGAAKRSISLDEMDHTLCLAEHFEKSETNSADEDEFDVSVLFSERFDSEYKKSKKAAQNQKILTSSTDKDNKTRKEQIKPKKYPPNYFVAVQISNPEIHVALKAVQESVLEANKALKPAMNPIATLHVTMFVMTLDTEDDMERARHALEKCVEELKRLHSPITDPLQLEVTGIGNFKDEIVFAKVKSGKQLDELQEVAVKVESCFKEFNINSADKRGFKPHITIMKLSRAGGKLRKKGVKKIDSLHYKNYMDTCFGVQTVPGLQICAMLKPKAKNGYYQLLHQVGFASPVVSKDSVCGPKQVHTDAREADNGIDIYSNTRSNDSSAVETKSMDIDPQIYQIVENCIDAVVKKLNKVDTGENTSHTNSNPVICGIEDNLSTSSVSPYQRDVSIGENTSLNSGNPVVSEKEENLSTDSVTSRDANIGENTSATNNDPVIDITNCVEHITRNSDSANC